MSERLPTATALPDGLTTRDQWVCWRTQKRNGKQTKVPIDPTNGSFASATNPETWGPFTAARKWAVDNESLGLGFVFTEDDQFVGVDLDDCRNPQTGKSDAWAESIIDQLDSYTEVSPSGTGYHVLTLGSLPDDRNRRGDLEMYDDARFFTVSGEHVPDTPETLNPAPDALTDVYGAHLAPDEETGDDSTTTGFDTAGELEPTPSSGISSPTLSDEQLLEKAKPADNGEKFTRLWAGQTTGYDSHSEADMALCSLLAFWTGGDTHQADRLFRQSGLMREKWDEQHYADGSTYGEKTIERAIGGCSAFYNPERGPDSMDQTPQSASATVTAGSTRRDSNEDADVGASTSSSHVSGRADSSRDQLDRVERLVSELDTAVERIEELEDELEAERTRSRELEVELAEVRTKSLWRRPFG